MRDWEEVAYSIDEEQSWRKEEAASSGKWKFEEVAFTMADSPEKGKIILDLTLPKLEITPKPGGIWSKLAWRFRKRLVTYVINSGAWAVVRRPTQIGDIWRLVDEKRKMEHGSFFIHQLWEAHWQLL